MTIKLYRHFDRDDVLLYVGISLCAIKRLSEHHSQSGWEAQIARVTIEVFPDRDSALRAEARAICNENPIYNKQRPMPAPLNYDEMMDLIQGAREEVWVRAWEGDPSEEIDETLLIGAEFEKELRDRGIEGFNEPVSPTG